MTQLSRFFITVLNMSITASYVIVGVLVLRQLLRRFPRALSYALWAVVIFRLICPVSFSMPVSLLGFLNLGTTGARQVQYVPANIGTMHAPTVTSGLPVLDTFISPVLPSATPAASINPMQVWIVLATIVWLAGVVALIIHGIVSYVRTRRLLDTATHLRENVYESDRIGTAFVCGFFSPKIYIPAGTSAEELPYILEHERLHIVRKDHLVKPLAYLAVILHWFNPLVWLSFALMTRDMEMSCDEGVVNKLGSGIKVHYSNSLLALSMNSSGLVPVCPLAFGESDVKQRIKNILSYKKPAFWLVVVAIVAVLAASLAFAANPIRPAKTNGKDSAGKEWLMPLVHKALQTSSNYKGTLTDKRDSAVEEFSASTVVMTIGEKQTIFHASPFVFARIGDMQVSINSSGDIHLTGNPIGMSGALAGQDFAHSEKAYLLRCFLKLPLAAEEPNEILSAKMVSEDNTTETWSMLVQMPDKGFYTELASNKVEVTVVVQKLQQSITSISLENSRYKLALHTSTEVTSTGDETLDHLRKQAHEFVTVQRTPVQIGEVGVRHFYTTFMSPQVPKEFAITHFKLHSVELLAGDQQEFSVAVTFDHTSTSLHWMSANGGGQQQPDGSIVWQGSYQQFRIRHLGNNRYMIVDIGTGGGTQGLKDVSTSTNPSFSPDVAKRIEELITEILSSPKTSSNPEDYIRAHQNAYEDIIKLSLQHNALPYFLAQFESGNAEGLRGHILMRLCKELLGKQDGTPGTAASPREWYKNLTILKEVVLPDFKYIGDPLSSQYDVVTHLVYATEVDRHRSTRGGFTIVAPKIFGQYEDGDLLKVFVTTYSATYKLYGDHLDMESAGVVPSAITYKKDATGTYKLHEYVQARDGSDWAPSIRAYCKVGGREIPGLADTIMKHYSNYSDLHKLHNENLFKHLQAHGITKATLTDSSGKVLFTMDR